MSLAIPPFTASLITRPLDSQCIVCYRWSITITLLSRTYGNMLKRKDSGSANRQIVLYLLTLLKNHLARVACKAPYRCSITDLLRQLHRLPLPHARIDYKILTTCIVYSVRQRRGPKYLLDLCRFLVLSVNQPVS